MKLKRIVLAATLTACLAGTTMFGVSAFADTTDTVDIPDATLKAAIIETLELPSSQITEADMKQLTGLETPVNDPAQQITSIEGLQYATNLKTLDLDYNKITDFSPIANLTKLETLDISYNNGAVQGTDGVTDISCLAGLTNLKSFSSIGNAGVQDYSVVSNFAGLTYLNLSICELSDVSFVSELTSLESLYLVFNDIYDVVPLQGLTSLKVLALGSNKLQDISVVADMTELVQFTVQDNYIEDFSPVLGLSKLNYLDVSRNFLSDEQMIQIMETLSDAETVYVSPQNDDSKKAELICLNTYAEQLNVGDTVTLSASTFDGTALDVSYSSSNEAIATVDADGKITAVSAGFCYIKATYNGYSRPCAVTVIQPDEGGDQTPGGEDQTPGGEDTTPPDDTAGGCSGSVFGAAGVIGGAALLAAVMLVGRKKGETRNN